MELEQQVCSLELAKKLKELGAKQDSFWSWKKSVLNGLHVTRIVHSVEVEEDYPLDGAFAAFTVAELGEMMPDERQSLRENGVWKMYIHSVITGAVNTVIKEKTEADARAKMLIYLIENKLITL